MNNVLIYSRRRNYKRLNSFIKKFFNEVNIDLISDERTLNKNIIWFGEVFYKKLNNLDNIKVDYDLEDIRIRCRYLRELKKEKAFKLIISAILSWEYYLKVKKYDLVYSLPIDSYINHTLYLVSKKLEINFLTPINSFYKDRLRFTEMGELRGEIDYKFLDNNEIENFKKKFQKNFKPDYLIGTDKKFFVTIIRRFLVDLSKPIFFYLYRLFSKDNFSFSFAPKKIYYSRTISSFKRLYYAFKLERIALKDGIPDNCIFIPLQFYPEATTDYWIKESNMINFHNDVIEIVKATRDTHKILIKEHPASLGRRDEKFLKFLFNEKHVYFIPTSFDTASIIEKSKLVISYGSTTSLQALLMNRKVLFLGTPYFGDYFPKITNLKHLEIIESINQVLNSNETYTDKIDDILIKSYLCSGSGIQGYFKILGEKSNIKDEQYVSESLIEHFRKSINNNEME